MNQLNMFDGDQREWLDMPGAEVWLWRGWLNAAEADGLYRTLCDGLDWRQPEIRIAGKTHRIPRLQAWYGESDARYAYSGELFEPEPWTPPLDNLRQRVAEACQKPFNSVLANYYRNGQDGVGWHSDDEMELGSRPAIASLSLGETRRFLFKPKKAGAEATAIALQSGDLLLMTGATQRNWRHSIPKTQKAVSGRINLTFRYVDPRIRASS